MCSTSGKENKRKRRFGIDFMPVEFLRRYNMEAWKQLLYGPGGAYGCSTVLEIAERLGDNRNVA
jgi:hypothetical protein